MRSPALLLCAAGVSACTPAQPSATTVGEPVLLEEGDCPGTGAATIRVADRDRLLPFDELRQIREEAERYLAEEEPELEPSGIGPGPVFIDCYGLSAWGRGSSSPPLEGDFAESVPQTHGGRGVARRPSRTTSLA
jgi:hypothetical protein